MAIRLHVVGGHIEDEVVEILKVNKDSVRVSWIRKGKIGVSTLYNTWDLIIITNPDKRKVKMKLREVKLKKVKNRFELMDLE